MKGSVLSCKTYGHWDKDPNTDIEEHDQHNGAKFESCYTAGKYSVGSEVRSEVCLVESSRLLRSNNSCGKNYQFLCLYVHIHIHKHTFIL